MAPSLTRREHAALVDLEQRAGVRVCSRCRSELPLTHEHFARSPKARSGFATACRACEQRRKRERERAALFPDGPTAVNRVVEAAPDREPAVRLREELLRRRSAGEVFSQAWPEAVAFAVRGLRPQDKREWRAAFEWSQLRWLAGYRPSCPSSAKALYVPDERHVPVAA